MPIYEYRCESCGPRRSSFVKPGRGGAPRCARCRKTHAAGDLPDRVHPQGLGVVRDRLPERGAQEGDGGREGPARRADGDGGEKKKDAAKTETARTETAKAETAKPAAPAAGKGRKKKP